MNQRFQVLFHSPPGVLFTFPSRYSCTIGRLLVLSLTKWSSQIHADFHGSGATRVPGRRLQPFAYGPLTLCGATFQTASARQQICNFVKGLTPLPPGPTTPNWQGRQALPPARFRLFPFRSPLLRESRLLSFPQGTEMFQFPWFPLPALCVQAGVLRC